MMSYPLGQYGSTSGTLNGQDGDGQARQNRRPLRVGSYQDAIAWLSQAALSNLPLMDLFQQVTQRVAEVLGAQGSDFWQILSDGKTYQRVASHPSLVQKGGGRTQQIIECNACVNAQDLMIRTDQPLDDTQADRWQWLWPETCPNGLAYVVRGNNDPLGVLTVYAPPHHPWPAEVSQLLQAISQLLITAIERKRTEALLGTQTQILEQVAVGANLSVVLNRLCQLLEQEMPGAFCSVLLRDDASNTLISGAAPSLPPAYARALNGLMIGPMAGSCGTAAHRGKPVFVNDVAIHPLWSPFRDLALAHNIRACWSTPFLSASGKVLGTFALSHQVPCQPNPRHLQVMKTAAHLASIATENHQIGERLHHQAQYDSLTNLANRHRFTEQLRLRLQQHRLDVLHSSQSVGEFAVLFLDVDRFKLINDSFGHTVGDQFLQSLAHRLLPYICPEDCFARLGGDEFGILINQVQSLAQAEQVVNGLLAALTTPLQVGAQEIMASMSVGIVHSSGNYNRPEDFLRDADIAMYRAKTSTQREYVVFDQTMHASVLARLHTEHDLRCAIETLRQAEAHPFQLYYQPMVCLNTGVLLGFEALLRWIHPNQGMISPERFIPIAEETGMIIPLGDWVIGAVCQQLQQWQMTIPAAQALSISVNVSAQQFLQPDLVENIQTALKRFQLSPENLKLEITESVLLEAAGAVTQRLHQLSGLGLQLSLDDFGTGYSSLSYLNEFPVKTLKIDRSFVQSLDRHQGKIVQAVVGLAQNLGMTAIAEGIETPAQLAYLKTLGCDQGQGYLFAKPLSVDSATALITQSFPTP